MEQNTEQRERPTKIGPSDFDKGAKAIEWGVEGAPTDGAGINRPV